MADTLKRSKIGYNGTGADGRPVVHWQWEPFGWGCSIRCMAPEKCWAEKICPRAAAGMKPTCEDCRTFKPHYHPKRVGQPGRMKTARVILDGFHTDWMCPEHTDGQLRSVCDAMASNRRHTFVTLTKRPERLRSLPLFRCLRPEQLGFVYNGCTIRNQADADEKMAHILSIPGKKWLSLEPLWNRAIIAPWLCLTKDGTNWARRADMPGTFYPPIEGVLIGHDNRPGAPGTDTLAHIRSCVEQCKAAGVNWWVKQIWAQVCDRCGRVADASVFGEGAIRGKYCAHSEGLGDCVDGLVRPRLLRASHPSEYALFPEDLKSGRLPWSAPKEHQNV